MIVWSLEQFSIEVNLGMDFMCESKLIISLDISSLANPKLIMFWRKGKKIKDEVTEDAYTIFLNNPKQTS
jgi:hypothetical protein